MTRLLALALLSCTLLSSASAIDEVAVFRVRQTVTLDQIPAGSKLVRWWIAIPDDARAQDVLDFDVVAAPGDWRITKDAERSNRFLYVEVPNPTSDSLQAVVQFTLRRSPIFTQVDATKVAPIDAGHRSLLAEHLVKNAPNMVVTPTIQAMADKACGQETNPAIQARKLLQLVADTADHYSKDPTKPNCGIGNADVCLEKGGGCCTDLHSLFIALARARGIPAKLEMGYRMLAKNNGKEVDPGYRCWVEYFLPGCGWVSSDIVEADAVGGLGPDRWFTGLTEERLWLNEGREFQLAPRQASGPVNTMIMGHAEIDGRVARVLPEGDLKPQLGRKVFFERLAAGDTAALAAAEAGAAPAGSR